MKGSLQPPILSRQPLEDALVARLQDSKTSKCSTPRRFKATLHGVPPQRDCCKFCFGRPPADNIRDVWFIIREEVDGLEVSFRK
jgi:hypothetical protein